MGVRVHHVRFATREFTVRLQVETTLRFRWMLLGWQSRWMIVVSRCFRWKDFLATCDVCCATTSVCTVQSPNFAFPIPEKIICM